MFDDNVKYKKLSYSCLEIYYLIQITGSIHLKLIQKIVKKNVWKLDLELIEK